MAKKATEESVSVYLRMPVRSRAALDEMSRQLNLKPSAVTNAIFRFVTQPDWFRDWHDHVDTLRCIVSREGSGHELRLHDFSVEEWQERKRTYERLDRMGLLEDFVWRPSSNHSDRIICSFKVSDTGRVVAHVFKEVGIADPVEQTELDQAPFDFEADTMAS